MTEIRQRLAVHRNDALLLLEQISKTARIYEGFRVAGAVAHLAQVQVLLAGELNELSGVSKEEPAAAEGGGESPEDDTPRDGIRLGKTNR